MGNPVVYWQMLTANPDLAASFYRDLFGWKISDPSETGYRAIDTGGDTGINGGMWPSPPGMPEAVQVYVQVDDIDAALARINELGGSTILPRQVLPDGDAIGIALDPLGRSFGVMTPRAQG